MDVVEVLKDLIKIDTRNPPGNTERAVEYLEEIFTSYNTKVSGKDGKMNLVVEISKGKPEFLFTSHLDTVPSDDSMLSPRVENGRVYGRGSCDAKGSVSAMVLAFHDFECDRGIKLAFTADEEVGGVMGLGEVMNNLSPDFVVVGEPFGVNRIGVAQAWVISAKLTVHGQSGHTAMADIKKGAVYRSAEIIINSVNKFSEIEGMGSWYESKIKEMGFELEFRGNGNAVFNPSIIRAGVKRNVVPDRCEIEVDIRIAPWINPREIREIINYEGVEIELNGFLKPFGFYFDDVPEQKDMELLEIMKRAIEKEGMSAKAVVSLGVGDIRHVRVKGIPAFYLGPRGENLHSKNEFVYIDELKKAIRVYRNIVTL